MPDLEQNAVAAWLTALRPGTAAAEWPPAIRPIEMQDDMPARLAAFGAALDTAAQGGLQPLAAALRSPPLRDELAIVLAQLGAARVLRVLHWLAEIEIPACHAVIAALFQDDGSTGQALRAAVAAMTRRAILRRMFAPERIAALENACSISLPDAA